MNSSTGAVEYFELQPPYSVILPFGEWDLYLVGYEGASQWEGPHQCGGIEDFKFGVNEEKVSITVNTANCAVEPYLTIKGMKAANMWDVAVWDTSNWE
ncbi:MAG TPA: hypothetical protein VNJ08_09810 [Bacteriovoracaceae bacterium]|nr:hypothetical protein [Bacteriovoracaceae bacterium]